MKSNTFPSYYVYFHVDPESEDIMYVGIGTKDRPWVMRNRHKDHLDWLERVHEDGFTMGDIVSLEHRDLSRAKALKLELHYINELEPLLNRNDKPNKALVLTKDQVKQAVSLREDGWSYKRIAKEFGVATMTIYRLLSGGSKKYKEYLNG